MKILAINALRMLWIIVVGLSFACGQTNTDELDVVVIAEVGRYVLDEKGITVTVTTDEGLIDYSMTGQADEELLVSHSGASVFQRWVIVIDQNNYLWFESSDIGGVVWIKDEDGNYIEKSYYNDPALQNLVPRAIERFYE